MLFPMAKRPLKNAAPAQDSVEPAPEPSIDDRFEKFLVALTVSGPDRRKALQGTGLTRIEISEKLETDREFARRFSKAWDLSIDVAEDEAARRAIEGWDEPIVSKTGDIVGYTQVYSDSRLLALLKANRGKWRGEDAGQRRGVSEESLREMRAIFDEAAAALP